MEQWRRKRAAKRVKPGDGQALPPFRWWQLLSRSVFTLELADGDGRDRRYTVDVRQLGDRDDGEVRARLYVDGRQHAVSRVPAHFPVPGGRIEVAVGNFGMRRCHHVGVAGERQLTPHPRSAEGRRAYVDRVHPALSRAIGVVSTLMVIVSLGLTVPQILEPISQIPPIADTIGTFESPLQLPLWLTVTLGAAAVIGSVERALRLRAGWLDDLAN